MRFALLSVAAALLMLAASGCNSTRTDQGAAVSDSVHGVGAITRVEQAPAPGVAPVFYWRDASGSERSLADYRGRIVLVNFWGTWCPPCRRELPGLVSIREEMAPRSLEIIGVNIGEQPREGKSVEEHVAAFAGSNSIRYPLLIGDDAIVNAYGGIEAVPTTFVVNRDGLISATIVGARSEKDFREAIKTAGK